MKPNTVSKSSTNFLIERTIDWSDPRVRREIGQALKRKREAESLPVARAASAVGISELHLEAIERGEWRQLPFEGAGRMWAEKYAATLKLDLNRFGTIRIRPSKLILSLMVSVLILAGLILLITSLLNSPPQPLNITTDLSQVFGDTLVSIAGSGEPGYTVDMLVAGTLVASTTVDADGNWSLRAELEPDLNEVTFMLGQSGSETPASTSSAAIAVATPTSTIRPRPTILVTATPTDTPLPTSTSPVVPTLTATSQSPTPMSNPRIDDFDSTQASGIAFGPNTPYLLGIAVDDRDKILRVEMRTRSVPPNRVDDLNIFIVDERQREEIFNRGTEPQDANIDAGVIMIGSEGRVIEAKASPPLPDVYLVIFNRSPISTEYQLKIFNGRFR